VAVWGVPRATQDIDLLVRDEAVPAALEVAHRLGFVTRALPMRFDDGMEVQRVSKTDGDDLLMLDLILVNANLESVWRTRQRLPIEGGGIWVVSREGLDAARITSRLRLASDLRDLCVRLARLGRPS